MTKSLDSAGPFGLSPSLGRSSAGRCTDGVLIGTWHSLIGRANLGWIRGGRHSAHALPSATLWRKPGGRHRTDQDGRIESGDSP